VEARRERRRKDGTERLGGERFRSASPSLAAGQREDKSAGYTG
jgi:hypothetical protein